MKRAFEEGGELWAVHSELRGELIEVPTFYGNRAKWVEMMRKSIATTREEFATKRMLEEYFNRMYIK